MDTRARLLRRATAPATDLARAAVVAPPRAARVRSTARSSTKHWERRMALLLLLSPVIGTQAMTRVARIEAC